MNNINNQAHKMTCLYMLAENFNSELSKNLIKMWLDLLDKYTLEEVQKGVKYVIETYVYKTMPPFAILRDAIDKTNTSLNRELEGAEAWLIVEREMQLYPRAEHKPDLASKILYALKLTGGYSRLVLMPIDDIKWYKKEFIDNYDSLKHVDNNDIQLRLEETTSSSIAELINVKTINQAIGQ